MQFTPQRLEKVLKSMRRDDIDALVITRRQDVQYLTGYQYRGVSVPIACVITEGNQPQLVIPDLQELVTSRDAIMGKLRPFTDTPIEGWSRNRGDAFWDQITGVLRELGQVGGMIGLQHDWLSVREFELLKLALPEAGFRDISQALWELRYIKDEAEISAILQAITIGEIGIRTALEIVASGKSEEETSLEIEAAMRRAGGQLHGIRAAVLSGEHARLPFVQPGAGRITRDDLIVLDMTVSHQGYFCEVARTIHLGRPTKKQRKLYEYVVNATRTIEKQLKPKTSVKDVSEKIMKKLGRGFPSDTLVQPFGNSIGLDLHEPPYLTSQGDNSLVENMVFSIHPTGFVEGVGTAKIADIVKISPDGCESLTTIARETM
ncbi:MAG: M24 family metallopeptidase [Candidatus Thorarchaeota archaeon]|jgi:Xaa-Pro aminopeptidase